MGIKKTIFFSFFLFSSSFGYPFGKSDAISLQYCINYAPVRGFMQIPCGGTPGTTSHQRPSLHEIGVDDTIFYDIDLTYYHHRLEIYLGAEINHLHGKRIVKEDLISHCVFILAGTTLNVHAVFDWYKAGAMYEYYFFKQRLWIAPLVEYAVLCFDYRFNAIIGKSRRTFDAPTIRLGFKSRYCFTQKTAFLVDGAASIPDLLHLDIYTLSAKFAYSWCRMKHVDTAIFLGLGIAALDFQDKQSVPNHMQLIMSPSIVAEIRLTWH